MKAFVQALGRRGPVVMSGLAVLLVIVALATGWERGLKDEGVVAHSWQLLVGLQPPLILAYLVTADWRRPLGVARVLAVQILGLALAMAPVAMLRL